MTRQEMLRAAQRIALANAGITPEAFEKWRRFAPLDLLPEKGPLGSALESDVRLSMREPEGNEIFVYGPIMSEEDADLHRWSFPEASIVTAKQFQEQLAGISGEAKLRINSPGGAVWELASMIQALDERPGKVVAVVDGLAASAASLLMAVCDHVTVARLGNIMIHRAWTCDCGSAVELQQTVEMLGKMDLQAARIYAERMDVSPDAVLELLTAETWYSAHEAVEAGLANAVQEKRREDDDEGGETNNQTTAAGDESAVEAANDRRRRFHAILGLGGE